MTFPPFTTPLDTPRQPDREGTDLLVVHCSATAPTLDIGVPDIDRWHRQRGFDTVGYHYVICRDGRLQRGRRESETGAHVKGYNSRSIGICLVGGVDAANRPRNNFTAAQFDTLAQVLAALRSRYPQARVLGHRDLSPDRNGDGQITPDEFIKACPCFDVHAWWTGLDQA
ncbi:N-acetylmuramoyl-L-alanine amidase [Pseudomonas syringae]|nr:N-acetylmuramoyl-L-alanine amidase [Pseudomonas syringae]MBD8574265.1 N-acetylmuramoyl-L-alanine amidase [Pseudomonas syringae]MBD8791762.1 N-acetylmuramoyl-L-alanine amidase [Pseudomonas syringae]MBD8801122.1 N-acetylmuramoyl-L-alanine amidase [Pseudomonas syringae]MBD8810526.1 N-acetylmuramoyl-L-alanine amidase [Pseudomonas syringae]